MNTNTAGWSVQAWVMIRGEATRSWVHFKDQQKRTIKRNNTQLVTDNKIMVTFTLAVAPRLNCLIDTSPIPEGAEAVPRGAWSWGTRSPVRTVAPMCISP